MKKNAKIAPIPGLTSVVICTHNMGKYLPGAVDSVLNQTSSRWECLILDDGSEDNTEGFLRTLTKDSRFRVYRNRRRKGLSACRNRLLKLSLGEYLSVLDADDLFMPDKIRSHAEVLSQDPHLGVVWGRSVLWHLGSRHCTAELMPPMNFEPGWDLTTPYSATHSATTWRKEMILRAGGYDPRYFLVEAPELFLRIGDFAAQKFIDDFAAVKRVFAKNEFRTVLTRAKRKALSRELFRRAVERRYGLADSPER